MKEDITKKPTAEIIKEMAKLEQALGLAIILFEKLECKPTRNKEEENENKKEMMRVGNEIKKMSIRYEELRVEIVKRFPPLEKYEEFQQKVLEIDKSKEYKII